ncbi:tRNA-modifying enzyme [candidate division MSBL1 archaeon SCGC-AAA261G05]|uniref:S-adenosyl-L-methionine-dependent tRNA 4-demethylwyosine synthase n=2 Tax=candidate division MSBL1 TaxID=215777 RepID=A0A133V1M2_9EURY|nr:tRNA-modifying enzyme [candidate division MSBL1 archaeon SCGC-AAA261C02]KXB04172.1 tRNA-modifying enzyme [candidate division MSBL1 archaeon SCGC-AAA261G05]
MMLSIEAKTNLEDSGYRIVGQHQHSAVKTCRWTKKSILDQGFCYKQKFYEDVHGIKSHRCLQMTPSLPFCDHRCIFCWRNVDLNSPTWQGEADEPTEILDGAIEAQRLLLSGFKGNPNANKKKWEEAQNPNLCAISLDGEPTLYPKLSELIEECHHRNIVPFLVTNGQHPEHLEEISEPSQLYISTVAPDEKTYTQICRPLVTNSWERLNESLELMPSFNCVKVLRLTLVKGWNLKDPSGYAKLVEKAEPDYIEPKGYMFVGHSRKRLQMNNMPTHEEIAQFAEKLEKLTGYKITDESEPSRVVLLSTE